MITVATARYIVLNNCLDLPDGVDQLVYVMYNSSSFLKDVNFCLIV